MRPSLLLIALLLSLPDLAAAALFRNETLQVLHEQGRDEELLRESLGRSEPEALAAQALAQAWPNDAAALARAVQAAEACALQHPQQAVCHYALGVVLGVEALRGGWFKGLGLIGRVRAGLERAQALDPQLFDARSHLQQLYLLLPGVAGGGLERARALELEVRDSQPEQAKLLRARLAIKDKRWQDAERELASIRLGDARAFQNDVLQAWSTLSRQWMKGNEHAHARSRFEALAAQLPQLALPVYALGRVAADAGQHEEALRFYARAQALSGARPLPLDHRMGLSLKELGRMEAAREHLQRFLRHPHAAPSALEDARKLLRALDASP